MIKIPKKAYYIYLSGFLLTEALIFHKGFIIWQSLPLLHTYFKLLALASLLIVIAILYIFATSFFIKKEK